MDKNFPESGRLSNLCTRIGLFSLKIRKSSAELGKVGSPVLKSKIVCLTFGVNTSKMSENHCIMCKAEYMSM